MILVVSTFRLVPFDAGYLVVERLGFTFDRQLRLLHGFLVTMPGPRHRHVEGNGRAALGIKLVRDVTTCEITHEHTGRR